MALLAAAISGRITPIPASASSSPQTKDAVLNYRHAFHAGNFADVVKHVALALCLERLNTKPTPYRYIDTHGGIGLYDLAADEAGRSPEWRDGVARVWDHAHDAPDDVRKALAPWLGSVAAVNAGELRHYPGSPLVAAHLMRRDDALRLCELHPADAHLLQTAVGTDRRVKIEQRDGFAALSAFLPPPERRGLVLIDPPFEAGAADRKLDFEWTLDAMREALKRWPTGVYLVWRPIKDIDAVEAFDSELAGLAIDETGLDPEKLLVADLWVRAIAPGKLAGAGLVMINAPYGVEAHLRHAMPWLAAELSQGEGAGWRLESPQLEEGDVGLD